MPMNELTALLAPPDGPSSNVDWLTVEDEWKVRFPEDYMAFVEAYGLATIDEFLTIEVPFGPERAAMAEASESATDDFQENHPGELLRMVVWGSTIGGVRFCWGVDGDRLDANSVHVWDVDEWTRHERDFSGFVAALLRGEIDEYKIDALVPPVKVAAEPA